MSVRIHLLTCLFFTGITGTCCADDFFETKIRPILSERCFKCHGEKQQKGGIRLDGPEFLKAAVDGSGPLVVPNKPDESRLIKAIRHTGDVKMPPTGKLPDASIQSLTEWVKNGAQWPAKVETKSAATKHWAFQPVKSPDVPTTKDANWPVSAIDNFVLFKLESKGLKPSISADRFTLIRRLFFDLTGLPPSAAEVDAFSIDKSPDAYEKIVDKLLASPAFGERWGRHWLDIARYSDTKGAIDGEDPRYPFAYTYRDWVVKSFNEDLPYDQFLIKQIAADHLTRIESHPDLAALGFLTLGRKFENSDPDIIDDRLDAIFRGTQALTISCARCHDHKYDPIPIKDYYSLYGVFAGAREKDVPLITGSEDRIKYQAYAAELRARNRSLAKFVEAERKRLFGNYRQMADRYLLAAQAGGGRPKEGTNREDGLNQIIVDRYTSFFEATKEEHNSIIAPWHAFAGLKPDRFAVEGTKLAKKFAANEDAEKPINPIVARLFSGKPPADLEDVANRYGRVFTIVTRKWQRKIAEADRNDTNKPTALDDEDEDEIRQLLFDDGSLEVPQSDIPNLIGEEKEAKFYELRDRVESLRNGPDVPPHARVLEDPDDVPAQNVFVRGKEDQPGEEVPRQFLAVLSGKDRQPFSEGTGRLELARAIANNTNPLTARVWVNRIWGRLFGRGLVETMSDFGLRTVPPTHPELLDWLADSLVQSGWSTKQLIRQIVLSNTYRQASTDRPDARKIDPVNNLLWRMNRKRLEVEALRDSLLAAAGTLDGKSGGRAVSLDEQPLSTRRAIYLAIDRGNIPGLFRVFDLASPDLHSPGRHETLVPQQALFLLNSPFVHEQARALAKRAVSVTDTDTECVKGAYRAAFGRNPTTEEIAQGVKFLASAAALKAIGPEAVPNPWGYGYGKWDGKKKQLTGFKLLTHFQDDQWRGGPDYPDTKLAYLALSASGGHPGANRDAVAVRRWHAPSDGEVKVEGLLKHALPEGEKPGAADGVKGYIMAGGKVLAEAEVFQKELPTNTTKIKVKAADTIDFVIDPKANDENDEFTWKIDITFVASAKPTIEVGFNSVEDFRGPRPPIAPPLTPREKFAQVLLMSNEFMYID